MPKLMRSLQLRGNPSRFVEKAPGCHAARRNRRTCWNEESNMCCHTTHEGAKVLCRGAPDKGVAVAGGERVEEHVKGEEHALQAAPRSSLHGRDHCRLRNPNRLSQILAERQTATSALQRGSVWFELCQAHQLLGTPFAVRSVDCAKQDEAQGTSCKYITAHARPPSTLAHQYTQQAPKLALPNTPKSSS